MEKSDKPYRDNELYISLGNYMVPVPNYYIWFIPVVSMGISFVLVFILLLIIGNPYEYLLNILNKILNKIPYI